MAELATTRLSSKGQVVIPEDVRQRLGLKAGDQFILKVSGYQGVSVSTPRQFVTGYLSGD